MMGSGKSTVSQSLARQVGMQAVDLDREIEQSSGKSISQIFIEDGEKAFRVMERDALRATINLHQVVIACGGGTPCHWEGAAFMHRHGTMIYLRATIETLLSRLNDDSTSRPLLNPDNHAALDSLLAARSQVYESAQVIVQVDGRSVDDIVSEICRQLDLA